MKKYFILFLLITPICVVAKPNSYEMNVELSLQGKPAIHSRMITLEGEKAEISQKNDEQEPFVEVIASEAENSGIRMKFQIGYLLPGGMKKITASPTIVAKEGEPAKVEMSDSKGKNQLALSVTAKRNKM